MYKVHDSSVVSRNLNDYREKPSSGSPISRTAAPGITAVQSDIMSTSCTLPSGPHRLRRKHSWAQPEKDGDINSTRSQSPDDGSDALARLVAIAKRSGLFAYCFDIVRFYWMWMCHEVVPCRC